MRSGTVLPIADMHKDSLIFVWDTPTLPVPSFHSHFGLNKLDADIADLAAAGHSLAQIALKVGRVKGTVKNRLIRIYDKTGANSRHDLLLLACGQPIFEPEADNVRN